MRSGGIWFGSVLMVVLVACARDHREGEPKPKPPEAPAGAASQAEAGSGGRAPDASAADGGESQLGATATVTLEPTAVEQQRGADALRGTATFRQTDSSVDLTSSLFNCRGPMPFELYIQDGADCAGARWKRGEGIPRIGCTGTSGRARGYYVREDANDLPWSIGGPERSDILGRALIVVDPATSETIACGVIARGEAKPRGSNPPPTGATSITQHAQIAGICTWNTIVRDSEHPCPNPKELAECASQHCNAGSCLEPCADYLGCLGESEEACSRQFMCEITAACADCHNGVTECVFGFCAEQIACAAPVTPDGPCAKLEACCSIQGDEAASCLDLVRALAKFSGDPSCIGAMHDWDFFSHLPVPCEFE
jgi:hypothetical protein